jgi:hypothetical protein
MTRLLQRGRRAEKGREGGEAESRLERNRIPKQEEGM